MLRKNSSFSPLSTDCFYFAFSLVTDSENSLKCHVVLQRVLRYLYVFARRIDSFHSDILFIKELDFVLKSTCRRLFQTQIGVGENLIKVFINIIGLVLNRV